MAPGPAAAAEHSITAVQVEHVGTLARPTRLAGGARAHAEGRLSADGLGALEDLAIFDSLWEQEAAGLEVFTDGQFRRCGGSETAIGVDLVADETAFLREHAPGLFKIAVPSPSARALGTLFASESSLAAPERHLQARAVEVASELSAAVAAGARYVELDADRYCLVLDPYVRATWRAWGI